MEVEHLNKSAAIRFIIRFVAKAYGLWPRHLDDQRR